MGSLQETEFIFVLLLTLTLPMFGRLIGFFRAKAATQAMAGDRDVGLRVGSFNLKQRFCPSAAPPGDGGETPFLASHSESDIIQLEFQLPFMHRKAVLIQFCRVTVGGPVYPVVIRYSLSLRLGVRHHPT